MANPNRKMATLRIIDDVVPIQDADRIESVRLGGWNVVVNKGDFKKGDVVVYFEIDTFLPTDKPQFKFLEARGVRTMAKDGVEIQGHVLKTIRLRGTYSQGLVLPLSEFPEVENQYKLLRTLPDFDATEHRDVSDIVGVWEYYKPLPPGHDSFTGKTYDHEVAPRTDAERIQNVSEEAFNLIKRCDYYVSVKVDGTSMTMVYDPRFEKIRLFSHNYELKTDTGIGQISYDAAKEAGIVDFCEANHGITVQYELCGPKIQSDRLALGKYRAFPFSVFDMQTREYRNPYEIDEIKKSCTPLLDLNLDDFEKTTDLLDYIDGFKGHVTKNRLDEGIVVHVIGYSKIPDSEQARTRVILDKNIGLQRQMKVINNKYLLKG